MTLQDSRRDNRLHREQNPSRAASRSSESALWRTTY